MLSWADDADGVCAAVEDGPVTVAESHEAGPSAGGRCTAIPAGPG